MEMQSSLSSIKNQLYTKLGIASCLVAEKCEYDWRGVISNDSLLVTSMLQHDYETLILYEKVVLLNEGEGVF